MRILLALIAFVAVSAEAQFAGRFQGNLTLYSISTSSEKPVPQEIAIDTKIKESRGRFTLHEYHNGSLFRLPMRRTSATTIRGSFSVPFVGSGGAACTNTITITFKRKRREMLITKLQQGDCSDGKFIDMRHQGIWTLR